MLSRCDKGHAVPHGPPRTALSSPVLLYRATTSPGCKPTIVSCDSSRKPRVICLAAQSKGALARGCLHRFRGAFDPDLVCTSPGCHYQVLGVNETATGTEIKAAFRRLALKLHPDVNSTVCPTCLSRHHVVAVFLPCMIAASSP
jgi:hypothetical protein